MPARGAATKPSSAQEVERIGDVEGVDATGRRGRACARGRGVCLERTGRRRRGDTLRLGGRGHRDHARRHQNRRQGQEEQDAEGGRRQQVPQRGRGPAGQAHEQQRGQQGQRGLDGQRGQRVLARRHQHLRDRLCAHLPRSFFSVRDAPGHLLQLAGRPFLGVQQRVHGRPCRSAEEDPHQALQGGTARGRARGGRGVDVAKALLLVPDDPLGLQLGQHGPHRGVAGRVGQLEADLLGGGLVAQLVQGVHDLAFAAGEVRLTRAHATKAT